MTMVPPSKSTPICRPRVMITATPARITSNDSAIACHRHLTKSYLGVKKTLMMTLDAQRGLGGLPPQAHFEQCLRHEYGREQVGEQPDRQRGRKAPNRSGAELEEKGRGDE